MRGHQQVDKDIARFIRTIENRGMRNIGQDLVLGIKAAITFVGAIDTRRMIQGVDHTAAFVVDGGRSMFVGSSIGDPGVFYDGFVEFDTRNRDGTIRPGRPFNQMAIENTDFQAIFDSIADDSFVI